mmetsp:Transcript_36121/g.93954  ORF Transcript_36121/g.93954 Transcript_36121/m.93954 type:complete len:123 (+) Transcript_36121:103-471(+)
MVEFEKNGPGKYQQGTGNIEYSITYEALVFRPFKGEVVDCVVENVTPMGFHGSVGPLRLFVNMEAADFDFNPTLKTYSSIDGVEIKKGSEVRVRLFGLNFSKDGYSAVASMTDDFLGVMTSG